MGQPSDAKEIRTYFFKIYTRINVNNIFKLKSCYCFSNPTYYGSSLDHYLFILMVKRCFSFIFSEAFCKDSLFPLLAGSQLVHSSIGVVRNDMQALSKCTLWIYRCVPRKYKDKQLCYILVLSLIMEEFDMNCNLLMKDLKLSVPR